MKRQLIVALSAALVVAAASAALVANAAGTSRAGARHGTAAQKFVGYWMGIDPLDGRDSRRGITKRSGGRFAVIGRDTVFTLCDGTDRAIVTTGTRGSPAARSRATTSSSAARTTGRRSG